ncbi:hypothetical protein [Streptomyces sp. 6N223]|uniref:hypothetical protein n=1 Tax=Streptomyces sp. 6N223 TaxID=3457412 RepID=UPI003FD1BC7F
MRKRTLTGITALALALTPTTGVAFASGGGGGGHEQPTAAQQQPEHKGNRQGNDQHGDHHSDLGSQIEAVKHATAQYHDVEEAEADGYLLATECVPGMGVHYARAIATDQEELDITQPNILVYAPQRDGSLELVAVEYGSESADELFGHRFDSPTTSVPFYSLHAWVWEKNPHGLFTAENPRISCPA